MAEQKLSQLKIKSVEIRKFNPKTDAKRLTEIWVDGLRQTVDSQWWWKRVYWRELFSQYAKDATAVDGDMGPEGTNLEKSWCFDEENVQMLVAELIFQDPKLAHLLVGSIGIKRGYEHSKDGTIFTIWKMSVDINYRGYSIGGKLLLEGEKWAKQKGGTKITAASMNPIASKFYLKHGYEWSEWSWWDWIVFKYIGSMNGKLHEKTLG
eukprot:TCONS_00036914-protein